MSTTGDRFIDGGGADPPCLATTRRPGRYRIEMASEHQHHALADALHAYRAAVVRTGYPSPFYDRLYAGCHSLAIPATTGQGGKRDARTEVLWTSEATAS